MIKFNYPFRNRDLKLGNDLVSITIIICINVIIFILYLIYYIIKNAYIWITKPNKKKIIEYINTKAFIIKANISSINYPECIEELGCCFWSKNHNLKLQKEDICYLYLAGNDYNKICYRLKVVSTRSKRKDEYFWNTPYINKGYCYKLVPTADAYIGTDLSYNTIESLGISKYASFKKLTPEQIQYIDKYFE